MLGDGDGIDRLIADLDSEDHNIAEEAEASLRDIGPAIVDPLLAAAPSFDRFGQLCAIELLNDLGDPSAGSFLISMLTSHHDTVRDWAAGALGRLGVVEAVAPLRDAYDATKRRGTPLDWTEPSNIRRALTELGGRDEVVPTNVGALAVDDRSMGRAWLPADLIEVLDALSGADQLVLSFMGWAPWRDSRTALLDEGWSLGDIDWAGSWSTLVDDAHMHAVAAPQQAAIPPDAVVTISWMADSDR